MKQSSATNTTSSPIPFVSPGKHPWDRGGTGRSRQPFKLFLPVLVGAVLLVAIAWLLAAPAQLRAAARYHYVAAGGADSSNCSIAQPCRTIQRAVSNAASGDEIRVAAGTYTGTVTLNKNLTLSGGFTTTNWTVADPTVNRTRIDAQRLGRVIYVPAGVSAAVSGFDLTGGQGNNVHGAGVYNLGTLLLEDSHVYDNQALNGGNGGGVASGSTSVAASLTVRNCQIYSNTTALHGGGLSVISGTAQVESSEIFGNASAFFGGGAILLGGSSSLRSNLIYNNTGYRGGGVFVNAGTAEMANNTLYLNRVTDQGGGVYIYAGSTVMVNGLIANNTATTAGGGVFLNTAGLSASFTDFHANTPNHAANAGGVIDPTTLGSENYIRDPLFVDAAGFDLHLSSTSPAIDSGTSSNATLDIDGNARPFGSAPDRGADEYYAPSPCYVRLDEGQVYTDLQAALDAAQHGSLVQVAGRCSDVHSRGGFSQVAYVDRSLTLRGGFTATNWFAPSSGPTMLDAGGLGRVVFITGTGMITPVIENLHLFNGDASYGGGVYVGAGVSATLQNNVIAHNHAAYDGGGLYSQGSNVQLRHNTLYANSAARGAGVFAGDGRSPIQPTLLASAGAGSDAPVYLRLRVGTFDPLAESLDVPARLARQEAAYGQAGLYLVQFPGPIDDAWYQAIEKVELQVVTYMPDYAYLVWGEAGAVERLAFFAPVRWSGVYEPFYALHPSLVEPAELPPDEVDEVEVVVQVYDHPTAETTTLPTLLDRAVEVLGSPQRVLVYRNLSLRVNKAQLDELAHLPDVVSVEPAPRFEMADEIQGQILAGNLNGDGSQPSGTGYLDWLLSMGFSTNPADYPIVDVTDDGIDNGSATPTHPDFYVLGNTTNPDRLVYNFNWTSDATADSGGGHGNIDASIVAGYNSRSGFPYEDGSGYNYGLGINPFGRVAGSKIFSNLDGFDLPGKDYTALISQIYAMGARISSNSWGCRGYGCEGTYTVEAQTYDSLVRDAQAGISSNQEIIILFAAGNSGSGAGTIWSPGTAKNVITVGAAENYRPSGQDGCGVGTSGADNANDIIFFSSRGPASNDARVKPDLVAPGTHIMGAATQDPDYNGTGTCDLYYPPGQTLYTWSSGTSQATPAVAGAASLLDYYYRQHFGGQSPSPAMTKAYLVNHTRYLDGAGAGGNLPSNDQGYGEVLLGLAFEDTPRVVLDQDVVLPGTGEVYELNGAVADPTRPFRVTLAWTDAPGATSGGAAYVNNLDLEVLIDGQIYRGNVFAGATSIAGGTPDTRNNVESVFLPAGSSGSFTVRVVARNIAGNGVPNVNGDPTDQDFALVVYNGVQSVVAMENNVVLQNAASGTAGGGGLYIDGGFLRLDYNDFYANTAAGAADDYGNADPGPHDLSVNPLLADAAGGDFHLTLPSPLIGAADPASTVSGDFEGDARPLGRRADIGPDESVLYAEVDLGDAPQSPLVVAGPGDVQGRTITFTHVLTNYGNTGGGQDTLLLSTANSQGWGVQLGGVSSPLVLPTGGSVSFVVSVTVPASIAQVYNVTTITATSQVNATAFDVARDLIVRPGVALAPSYTENLDPGSVFTYTHTLTNTGDGPDSFTLSAVSPLGWTQLITPTAPVTLSAGQALPVLVRVRVADTAPAGLADVAVIRARSGLAPAISAVVTDTTIANPTSGNRYVVPSPTGINANNNCTQEDFPCASIGYALTQAAWGDAILVAQGTYAENNILIGQDQTLRGGYVFDGQHFNLPAGGIDPSDTVLDAQGSERGIRVEVPGMFHPLIEGFTIRNTSASGVGGAVYIAGTSAPTLTNMIILNSTATRGGAVYVEMGNPVLEGLVIAGSSASQWGGGIYVGGGNPLIRNVEIANTSAVHGGAIYVAGGEARLEACALTRAQASRGAGLYVAGGALTVQDLRLSSNSAASEGGGIYQAGGTLVVSQTHIFSNTAASGGGVYNQGGNLSLWNSLVYSNTARSGDGGGIYKNTGALNVVNDTLYNNHASGFGGGLFDGSSLTLVLSNTLFVENTAGTAGGGLYRNSAGAASIDYNDLWNNSAPQSPNSNVSTGAHSISADPLFEDAAAGNFHLAFGSPCIDSGDPHTFLRLDFENDRRPSNQGYDIGADELSGCLARNPRTLLVYGVLQDAIDAAIDNDTIQISGRCWGTQQRMVDGRLIDQTALVDKDLTLAGGYSADFSNNPNLSPIPTTLDALGQGRVLVVHGSIFVRVSHLTLTGGDATGQGGGPSGADAGGGIYSQADTLFVQSSVISDCRAGYGGGLYQARGDLELDGTPQQAVRFVRNNATYGGGLYLSAGSLLLERAELQGNTAQVGGGLYNFGASPVISMTGFYTNSALGNGGAVYNAGGWAYAEAISASHNLAGLGGAFYNASTGRLDLQRALVQDNRATGDGGGVYNRGVLTSTNVILADNWASGGSGGGLYNQSAGLIVRHNTLYANHAADRGGGIFHDSFSGAPLVNSTLIVSNTAVTGGGGIHVANTPPAFHYNDVYGNVGGDYGGNPVTGNGNLSLDPMFLSTDPASRSFLRLAAGTPVEDQADPLSPVAVDIDMDPRPTNRNFDIGADEVGNCYVRINGVGPIYGNVQRAVGFSQPGDTLFVAGICLGVNTFVDGAQTVSQTVFLTRSLDIRGGYTRTNWLISNPITNPTYLDAQNQGRVVYISNSAVVSMTGLHLRSGSGTNGGAIYVGEGGLTLTGSLVYSNTAANGAAIYNAAGTAHLIANSLFGNTAGSAGGAAYGAGGQLRLDSNRVWRNRANQGGALYHAGGTTLLQNNVLWQNQATADGAGIYNAAPGLTVRHNTLYANAAGGNGGGLYTSDSTPVVVNNVFLDNSAAAGRAIYGAVPYTSDYNDAYPAELAYGGGAAAGSHSLSVDPLLVDPANGDFHLQLDSPVIDRGDPSMTLLHDFEHHLRPSDQGFDMGADEILGCWARNERTEEIYGNVQRAVDNSEPGDTIQVSVGECRGVHPYSTGGRVVSQTIHIPHSLTLHGGFSRDFLTGGTSGPDVYPDPTASTINPLGLGRAILVTGTNTVTLRRFILIGGNAAGLGGGPGGGDAGGGLYTVGGSGELFHVDFYYHTAAYGGAYYNAAASLFMRNSWINYNHATQDGGAIYNAAGTLTMTTAVADTVVQATRLYSNTAGQHGGAIYNAEGNLWIVDNNTTLDSWGGQITLNAAQEGGMLYNDRGQAYLYNNTIFDNSAVDGGAIYNNFSGRVVLDRGNRLYENMTTAGNGGAVYNLGDLQMWNNLVYRNAAFGRGGAVYAGAGSTSVLHNTFYQNESTSGTGRGGAIFAVSGHVPTIQNNIFDSNVATQGSAIYAGAGTLGYNDYWVAGAAAQVGGGVSAGDGNLNANPTFVNVSDGDFHLQPESPLIDVGANLNVPNDFEGDPRPINRAPDIGADEYNACLARVASSGIIYGSIGQALAHAPSGDTIQVAEGLCQESFTINKNITIEGSWPKGFIRAPVIGLGQATTTIEPLGSSRVITVNAGFNVSIENVVVTGGETGQNGGGIWSAADQLSLSSVVIRSNSAVNGGGLYVDRGIASVLETAVLENRASGSGGGIFANTGVSLTLQVKEGGSGVYIEDNSALIDGGGLYNGADSVVVFDGGGMSGNQAGHFGGAIYNAPGSIVDVNGGSTINTNQAERGGGIYNDNATLEIRSKQVNYNTATQHGGGIYTRDGSLMTINLGLYRNTAAGSGGGIYREGSGSASLYHATVRANTAESGQGGGIYQVNSSMVISASIVAYNVAPAGGGAGLYAAGPGSVNLLRTLGWQNEYVGNYSLANCMTGDPQFLDDSGDLLHDSPAIDAVPNEESTIWYDRVGDPRPLLCAKDMGRDEYAVGARKMTWVSVDPLSAEVMPGGSVTHTFNLRNDSENWLIWGVPESSRGPGTGYTETITLTLSSSKGWSHIVAVGGVSGLVIQPGGRQAIFEVGPGRTATILVRATVPGDAYASLEEDPNTQERIRLSYEAWMCSPPPGIVLEPSPVARTLVKQDYAVEVGPANTGAAQPGQTLLYQHVVTNTGNVTDTYTIVPKAGFYATGVTAEPASYLLYLTPGQTATIAISVTIRPEAAGGLVDQTWAMALSNNSEAQDSAPNDTTILSIAGTRYVALNGDDSLVDETEIYGTDVPDNNCTQPSVAPCRTLGQALSQAASGDEIRIAAGTYAETVTATHASRVVTQTVFVNKPVTLRGGYLTTGWDEEPPDHTAHPTLFDPHGAGRAVYVIEGLDVTLERLVLAGGSAAGLGGGPAGVDAGGALYNAGATLTLDACRIYGSTAAAGGALYSAAGSLHVQNSMLHDTQADTGGAVYVASGSAALVNDTFYRNQAAGNGGAVYAAGGSLAITSTIFSANTAASGGAVHAPGGSLDYNLYHNNTPNNVVGPGLGAHAVFSNPLFVDPLVALPGLPDLHLLRTSPAREAADPATDLLALPYDYDTDLRRLGTGVDVGADEFLIQIGPRLEPNYLGAVGENEAITYTHTLSNAGELTDTFGITFSSSRGWATLLTPGVVTLGPNQVSLVQVRIDTAAGSGGQFDLTVITATSQIDARYYDVATDRTNVDVPRQPEIEVTPLALGVSLNPGNAVNLPLTIRNASTATANLNWTLVETPTVTWLHESPPDTGSLAPGDSHDVTVAFSAPITQGVYSTILSIGSDDRDEDPIDVPVTLTVTEQCLPVSSPDFAFAPSSPQVGQTIVFTGSAGGTPPISYAWTFGDGSTANGAVVTHTYGYGTTYNVVVSATNSCGGGRAQTRLVTVAGTPVASVSPAALDVTLGPGETQDVTLQVRNGLAATGDLLWDASELPEQPWLSVTPASGAVPQNEVTAVNVRFDSTGLSADIYTTTLRIASNDPDDDPIDVPVTMRVISECTPITGVDFSFDPPVPRVNGPVSFNAAASPSGATQPIDYAWAFGDGDTGQGASVNHTYSLGGTYRVVLTATNHCSGLITHTRDVTAVNAPHMTVSPLLLGAEVNLGFQTQRTLIVNNADTASADLQWSLVEAPDVDWLSESLTNGTIIPGGEDRSDVTFDAGAVGLGVYTTTLQITSNDPNLPWVEVSVVMTVTERCIPVNILDFTFSPPAPQVGQTVTFTGSVGEGTPPLTYTWGFGDGGTGSGQVVTHAYAVSGTYRVALTATNACPSEQSFEYDLLVVAVPDVSVSPSALSAVLAPGGTDQRTLTIGNASDATADLHWTLAELQPGTWLTATPSGGTLVPGASVDVTTMFDATGLVDDVYTTTLRISSDDPDENPIDVPVTLTVSSICTPIGSVAIAGQTIGTVDTSYTFTATVSPAGATPPIAYTWSPEPESGQSTPFAGYRWPGTGDPTITVTASNCGGEVFDTHTVLITDTAHPDVQVSPTAMSVTLAPNDTTTRTLTVANTGSAPLTWGPLSSPAAWLSWAPVSGSTPAGSSSPVVLYFDAAGLSEGITTTTLLLPSDDPDEDPVSVPLTLTVSSDCVAVSGVAIGGPSGGYTGTLYTFQATVTPANASQPIGYVWSPEPESGQGTVSATYRWSVTGTQTVSVTASNCGGSASSSHAVTILQPPTWRIYLPLVTRGYRTLPMHGPDLVVSGITVSPAQPQTGQPATVSVTVRNRGDEAVALGNNFYVDFYVNRMPALYMRGEPGCEWGVQGAWFPVGGTRVLTCTYSFNASAQVYAQIDTDDSVLETSESNNTLGPVPVSVLGLQGWQPPIGPVAPGGDVPTEPRPTPTPQP